MTNPPKPSYENLPFPHFLDVFKLVDKVMTFSRAKYYLIGSAAANLLFLEEGIDPPPSRLEWNIVDFAVRVDSLKQWTSVFGGLIREGFWVSDKTTGLLHEGYGVKLVVVMFGRGAEEAIHPFVGKLPNYALGIRGVLAFSTLVLLDDKLVAEVPTLPGIAMQKLVAWSMAPERRESDLDVVHSIVVNYVRAEHDSIVASYGDSLLESGDSNLVAAEIMGRKMIVPSLASPELRPHLLKLLHKRHHVTKTGLAPSWSRRFGWDLKDSVEMVNRMRKGLMGN